MKHLPKHLQPRWRYLAVAIEAWPDAAVGRGRFQRHCWYAAQNLLGDAVAADLDLTVVRFEYADGAGHAIVRTRRGTVEQARAALACVDAVDGDPVGLRVMGVGGTVRACAEKYIQTPPEGPGQRHVAFEGSERPAFDREDRVDVRTDAGFVGATPTDLE